MRNRNHIIFVTLLALSGCDNESKKSSQKDDQTGTITKYEKVARNKLGGSQDKAANPTEVHPIREIEGIMPQGKEIEKALGDGNDEKKILKRSGLTPIALNLKDVAVINNSIKDNPIIATEPNIQIKTATAAFERINVNFSMAAPPKIYAEDEVFFIFQEVHQLLVSMIFLAGYEYRRQEELYISGSAKNECGAELDPGY